MLETPPIRVVLDDRPLRRTLTGVGNYIAQLLTHFPEYAPEFQLDPFVFTHLRHDDWRSRHGPPTSHAQPAIATPTGQAPMDRARAGRSAQTSDVAGSRKPWWMRRAIQGAYGVAFRWKTYHRYTLYHEPNHVSVRSDLPIVTTIHDLSVLVHPEWHPADRVKWYEKDFQKGLNRSRHFVAASEFTRQEMIQRLDVSPDRITVTYQAPRVAFNVGDSGDGPVPVRKPSSALPFDVPENFFLYVGTIEPRKNVDGLLDAYASLPAEVRKRHPLLIAGAWGWKADALREKFAKLQLGDDVRLLGYMHDPQLAELYRRCTALVWPTYYEGFGLPPLEAMACGAPVIVSNVASLPEVVGDAGMLLDPADTEAWRQAMQRLAEDPSARGQMRARSIQQSKKFTWQHCVANTAVAYCAALELDRCDVRANTAAAP